MKKCRYPKGSLKYPDREFLNRKEKTKEKLQEELIEVLNRMLNPGFLYPPSKVCKDLTDKVRLEKELDDLKNRNCSKKYPSVKICAGCGSFAHGNSGHDIT